MPHKHEFWAQLALWILLCSTLQARVSLGAPGAGVEKADVITGLNLVAPGVGWVALMRSAECAPGNVVSPCPPMRLYWTADNGKSWKNITPPDLIVRNIQQVFFLDHLHGWMLSWDALDEVTNAPFFLHSTEDGGATWQTLVLQRPMFDLMDDYTFPVQLFFSDAQHGWMLWRWGMMNSRLSYLLTTADGGRSWRRLPDPPLTTEIAFTSPTEGWIIGTSNDDQGIPITESDAVWTTLEGGASWREIALPMPVDSKKEDLYFSAVKFSNRSDGVVVAERQSSEGCPCFAWVTHNAGKTWKRSGLDAPARHVSLIGSRVILSFLDPSASRLSSLRIRNNGQAITPVLPENLPRGASLGQLDFITDTDAWLNVHSALLASADGGKSFRVILPSSGEPEWPRLP